MSGYFRIMRSYRWWTTASLVTLLAILAIPRAGLAQEPSPSPLGPTAPSPSPYPLEATAWRLQDYRWLDQMRGVGPEVVARVSLARGRVRGHAGCNRLDGTYEARPPSTLSIAATRRSERACAEQTMVVEQALLHGLGTASTYSIVPAADRWQAQLIISDAFGNEQLRFRVDDAGSLTTGQWWLDSYTRDGVTTAAVREQRSVLTFDASDQPGPVGRVAGDAVGSTGCNGVVAEFFQHGSVLSFGPLERTDAPCGAELAAQEEAIVAVLDATSLTLDLPPGRLVLVSADDGNRLDFVSSSPLEGSTWLLSGPVARSFTRGDVTLRLVDGVVSGEGPCGSYSGSYETNGVLIRIRGLGAIADDCDDARATRRYLSALRRARFADLTRPGLRFLDKAGRTAVSFRDPSGP